MIDIPLLRKAVEWVEEQEKLPTMKRTWYQGSWGRKEFDQIQLFLDRTEQEEMDYCGTNLCLAGHIAVLTGWDIQYKWRGYGNFTYAVEAEKNGETVDIQDIAINELGATVDDLHMIHNLFHGENDAVAIREAAEHLVGERL